MHNTFTRLPIGHSPKSVSVKALGGNVKKYVKFWGSEHQKRSVRKKTVTLPPRLPSLSPPCNSPPKINVTITSEMLN